MKRDGRHDVARVQGVPLDQFKPYEPLEHVEQQRLVGDARRDLLVAALARLDARLERGNLAPECLVAKRFQPFLHILPVGERSHGPIMPDRLAGAQICT